MHGDLQVALVPEPVIDGDSRPLQSLNGHVLHCAHDVRSALASLRWHVAAILALVTQIKANIVNVW